MKALRLNTVQLLIAASALACASHAMAQAASGSTSTPAKKELVARLLKLEQPGVEMLARNMLQAPVGKLMQGAAGAIQQLPAEKREAAGKAIEADVKKFVEENDPYIRDKAVKLAPAAIGPMLEEKLTEDELRQVLTWLESPVSKKFGQLNGDMQKAISDKLLAENGSLMDERFRALQQSIGKTLGMAPPPANAASKPAGKSPVKK